MRKVEFNTDLYDLEVYEDGTIFNKTLNKNQETHKLNTGHLFINVKLNGVFKNILVHRLVYSLFNGSILDGYVIHHVDENKDNNSLNNLVMMDSSDHARLHNQKKYFDKIVECPICGKSFLWTSQQQSNFYRRNPRNKHYLGVPFCSRKCQGIYGKRVQVQRNSKRFTDKILCEELESGKQIVFNNGIEAIEYLLSNGIGTTRDSIYSSIRKCIRGIYKTAFGFKWSLV